MSTPNWWIQKKIENKKSTHKKSDTDETESFRWHFIVKFMIWLLDVDRIRPKIELFIFDHFISIEFLYQSYAISCAKPM